MTERERAACIIEPYLGRLFDAGTLDARHREDWDKALAKADAILALPPSPRGDGPELSGNPGELAAAPEPLRLSEEQEDQGFSPSREPSLSAGSMSERALPTWKTGRPTKPGVYVGFSDHPARTEEAPSIYRWEGGAWQHWTGWYDGAITHWMPTDMPDEDEAPEFPVGAVQRSEPKP